MQCSKLEANSFSFGGKIVKPLKTALASATFLVGIAASAHAADVDSGGSYKDSTGPYGAPITWVGFYAGIHLGSTFDDTLTIGGAEVEVDEAFVGGVHIGYNWQAGSNLIYGLEADVSYVDDELDGESITSALMSFRGRLGYAAGRTLIYATGGLALLSFDEDFAPAQGADDPTLGFVVGGGIEYKFKPNLSLGVEGLYYDVNSDIENTDLEIDRDLWTVRARLTYHTQRAAPLK